MKKTLLATVVALTATVFANTVNAVTVFKSADEKATVNVGVDFRFFEKLSVNTAKTETTNGVVKTTDGSTGFTSTVAPRLNLSTSYKFNDQVTLGAVARLNGSFNANFTKDSVSVGTSVPSLAYHYGYVDSKDFGKVTFGKYYHEAALLESSGPSFYLSVGTGTNTLVTTPDYYFAYSTPSLDGFSASLGYGTKQADSDKVRPETLSAAASYDFNGNSVGVVANFDQKKKASAKQESLVSGAVSFTSAKLDEATGATVSFGASASNKVAENKSYEVYQGVFAGVQVNKLDGVDSLKGAWVTAAVVNAKEGAAPTTENTTVTYSESTGKSFQAVVGSNFTLYENKGVRVSLLPEYKVSVPFAKSKEEVKWTTTEVTPSNGTPTYTVNQTTSTTSTTGGTSHTGQLTFRVTY